MADQLQTLQQDFDEIKRRVNEMSGVGAGGSGPLGPAQPDFQPLPIDKRTPAANQIWNGDFSHSVSTWNDAVLDVADKAKECFNWFSNDAMSVGQALDFTDARTSSANKTLKYLSHTTYDANYADWDRATGNARITGTKTLDAPLPQNTCYPGRTKYLGAIIALANSQIVVATDTHLSAGIYDNTAGQRDWLKANTAFAITTAEVRGTPAATEQLKYKIWAKTDRGYTYLSAEVTVAAGPTPGSFSSTVDVYLSWERIEGVLEYWVVRHRTGPNIYDILTKIGSGANTYADNNTILEAGVAGYPAATEDRARAFVATLARQRADGTWVNDLSNVAVNGVDLSWDALFLNIPIPATYQQSNTTGRQVLRIALDKALDRQFAGVAANNGNTTISTPTDQFTSLDAGRTVTLTSADGLHTLTTTINAFTDTKHLVLTAAPGWTDANTTIYIVGGGDHGLLIDLIHLGDTEGAAFAPHPDDFSEARRLQPAAAPNGSTQGGTVGGGGPPDTGDGGIGGCIVMDLPVATFNGDGHLMLPFQSVGRGWALPSGNLQAGYVTKILTSHCGNVWRVRIARARVRWWERLFGRSYIEIVGSPEQRLITSAVDRHGASLSSLQTGEFAVASWHGRMERSEIIESSAVGEPATVGIFALAPGHTFFAGRLVAPWFVTWLRREFGRLDDGVTAALLHNVKQTD
jgi:hypothetical protein